MFKKNLNASRPFEHPPVKGGNVKTSSWHLNGFPDGSNIGSTVCDVGKKPIVILYTYIIGRHCFLTFSVLVANPKKLLYTLANTARGLLEQGNVYVVCMQYRYLIPPYIYVCMVNTFSRV